MSRFKRNFIKQALEWKEWTAKDLADYAGISERSAYYLQKKDHEPTGSMLIHLARVLDIHPGELIELHGEDEKPS